MARSKRPRCLTTKMWEFLTVLPGAQSAHYGQERIVKISAVLPGALSAHNGQEGEILLGAAQRRREINGAFGRLTSVGSGQVEPTVGARASPTCGVDETEDRAWPAKAGLRVVGKDSHRGGRENHALWRMP